MLKRLPSLRPTLLFPPNPYTAARIIVVLLVISFSIPYVGGRYLHRTHFGPYALPPNLKPGDYKTL